MNTTALLILKAEPVPRMSLGPQKPRSPSVAVVYATSEGDLHVLGDGRPMAWSSQLLPPYRMRYEVDLSDHVRTVRLQSSPPVAAGGAYCFEATLNVGFRVVDPAQVVKRNIRDGQTVVYNHLMFVCHEIAKDFGIEQARDAEEAINRRFASGEDLPEGIRIFMCRARILADEAARRYLDAQEQARRENIVKAEQHQVNLDDAMRGNAIALVEQSGRHVVESRESAALAGMPLDAQALIRLHLQRNPGDTEKAFGLQAAVDQAEYQRQRDAEQRQRDALEFLARNDLLKPVDVERYRDSVVEGLHAAPGTIKAGPAKVGWDDPLPAPPAPQTMVSGPMTPGLIPVYVVMDQSLDSSIDDLNVSIGTLYEALAHAPEIANVIRLSVYGFADDVDVQLALERVGGSTMRPHLRAGGHARYAAAFQRLLDCIPRDAETLKAQHPSVRRPQVLFLAGNSPADGTGWMDVHRRLIDRTMIRSAPDIVACGVGGVPAETIATVATRREYAFVAIDGDIGRAIAQFSAFVRDHVLSYGRAVLDGDQGPVITTPAGFRPA